MNRGVYFIRGRSSGSTVVPQVEDGGDPKTEPAVTTMADSVRPLLASMKLFGLYFKRGTATTGNNKMTEGNSRRRWNGCMIYGLVVVILIWVNVARMFSVLKKHTSPILTYLVYFFPLS